MKKETIFMAIYDINRYNFLDKLQNASNIIEARSIAAQARDNIFMYRVGMSQSVGDIKLAMAINKYIESMCCVFTLIVSGINPIVKNNALLELSKSFS
jgi:predicted transcriptional regulator